MYTLKLSANDKIVESNMLPQSCTGAPLPLVISDEQYTFVAYYNSFEGNNDEQDTITIVKFQCCLAILFGPPNDEVFSGHPLYKAGLRPYSFSIVENSSWIEEYRIMNSVHPYHSDIGFNKFNHYILAFHDSVFECVAENLEFKIINGKMSSAFVEIGKLMEYKL